MVFSQVLTAKGKENIKKNKYVPGGKSLITPFLNDHLWEPVVTLIPKWIAPNVLTLTGFTLAITQFYVYFYFDPDLEREINSFWFYIYQAISLFLYNTLDAIDGKHARNTKNGSPLGQLFDHGCDALVITPLTMLCCIIMTDSTNNGWLGLTMIIMFETLFYILNWKAKHFGKLDFGLIGDVELEFATIIVYLITAFTGPAFWNDIKVYGVNLGKLAISCAFGPCLFYSILSIYQVNKYYASDSAGTIARQQYIEERFYEFGNFILFHVSLFCWNLVGSFNEYPVIFSSAVSFAFGHLIHQLIICEITKQKPRKIQYIVILFLIVGLLSIFEFLTGKPILYGLSMKDFKILFLVFMYSLFIMMDFAVRCMIEISNLLDIRIFFINKPKTSRSQVNDMVQNEQVCK